MLAKTAFRYLFSCTALCFLLTSETPAFASIGALEFGKIERICYDVTPTFARAWATKYDMRELIGNIQRTLFSRTKSIAHDLSVGKVSECQSVSPVGLGVIYIYLKSITAHAEADLIVTSVSMQVIAADGVHSSFQYPIDIYVCHQEKGTNGSECVKNAYESYFRDYLSRYIEN